MRKMVRLGVLLLSLTFLWGCELALLGVGAGLGVGTYSHVQARISKDYPLAYKKAWESTNTALNNLAITVTNKIDEGVRGQIEAVRKDGAQVMIDFKDRGQGVTTIGIRAGVFSGRNDAERIHEEIATAAGLK